MELPSSIPTFIDITAARPNDVNFPDRLIVEPGAFYVMDRGYMDFQRLYRVNVSGAFFVTRIKRNIKLSRRYSHPRNPSEGILSEFSIWFPAEIETVVFPGGSGNGCAVGGENNNSPFVYKDPIKV